MAKKIHIVIVSTIILLNYFSQCDAQDSIYFGKFGRMVVKKKIDSLKNKAIADSNYNTIIYFGINIEFQAAYGCIIKKRLNVFEFSKITIYDDASEIVMPYNKVDENLTELLKESFMNSGKYLDDSLLSKKEAMPDENIEYLFMKQNGIVVFDKYFLTGNVDASENKNFLKFRRAVLKISE